ncbi:hypothetical protein MMAR_3951 [Mycobacterium marinum M]|uniref:Uncharacterized protein n=1 Tax=Mycobacterium marinum (strain ATCC BAA-535 / M) TaxID=216594 RepID=B2HPK7_MYCMM|nr:hypothetical protein [Mycobacterium marinum]ACC42359.1 hypothetical protein MMAR_3951 [Mycobacterium marinum M]
MSGYGRGIPETHIVAADIELCWACNGELGDDYVDMRLDRDDGSCIISVHKACAIDVSGVIVARLSDGRRVEAILAAHQWAYGRDSCSCGQTVDYWDYKEHQRRAVLAALALSHRAQRRWRWWR